MSPLFGCICLFVLLNSSCVLVHCMKGVAPMSKSVKSSKINTNGTSGWLASGGSYTEFTDFPHVIYISVEAINTHCTGTFILHPKYVLTAAHCLLNPSNRTYVHPSAVRVSIASNVGRIEEDNKSGQLKIRGHPQYTISFKECLLINPYDIAILVTMKDLEKAGMKPFSLPNLFGLSGDVDFLQIYGAECSVTGYGITSATDTQHLLNTVKINILPIHRCQALGLKVGPQYHICAYTKGRGLCSGDDGAALICEEKMVGVLSITNGCSKKEGIAVFIRLDTRIDEYLRPTLSDSKSFTERPAKNSAFLSQSPGLVPAVLLLMEILKLAIASKQQ